MPNLPPRANSRKKPKYNKTRNSKKSVATFHASGRWARIRNAYRAEQPMCQRCLYLNKTDSYSLKGLSVHHIQALAVNMEARDRWENLLTLCGRCHNHFNRLERSDKGQQSEDEGKIIKRNLIKQGHKIALLGNINSGKSAVIDHMRELYTDHKVIAIDDYRRTYGNNSYTGEDAAQFHFMHDIKKSSQCIVVCVGYGRLWDSIRPSIDKTLLIYASVGVCATR